MSGPAAAVSPHSAPVLTAPAHWRVIDFISDLHLNAGEPDTLHAWQHYLQTTRANAVFILGDLFDVWVGDDVLRDSPADSPPIFAFEQHCVQTLHAASQRLTVFFMRGNRDFLVGKAFAAACDLTLMDDPTVLIVEDERYLLSHGDSLCLDDTDYMQFRAMARSDTWQRTFLQQSLQDRCALGKSIRAQSEERKRRNGQYIDLRASAVDEWLLANRCSTLIHGHTHRPAVHALGANRRRVVLSDWDARSTPARTEVLRLCTGSTSPTEPTKVTHALQRIEAARAHLP
jgi:UDP-2,3-diacylglucosamine hydrolase